MGKKILEPSQVTRSMVPQGGQVGRAGTGNSHSTPSSPSRPHSPTEEVLAQTVLVVHRREIHHRGDARGDRTFFHVSRVVGRHNTPPIGRRTLISAWARDAKQTLGAEGVSNPG